MQTNYNSYNPYFGLNLSDDIRKNLQKYRKPNEVRRLEDKFENMGHNDYTVRSKWEQNGGKGVCKIVANNGDDTVILAQNGTLNGALQKFIKLTKEEVDSMFTAK